MSQRVGYITLKLFCLYWEIQKFIQNALVLGLDKIELSQLSYNLKLQ